MLKSNQPIKAKLESDLKEEMKSACATAVNALQIILTTVSEAAGKTEIPGLKAGLNGLLFIVGVGEKTSQDVQDIEEIRKRIDSLMKVILKSKDEGKLSSAVLESVDPLASSWSEMADDLKSTTSRSPIDAQLISSRIRETSRSIESFTVEIMLAIEFTISKHLHHVGSTIRTTANKPAVELHQLHAIPDIQGGQLPCVEDARFDCKDRTPCLAGTRTAILAQISHWIGVENLFGSASIGPTGPLDVGNIFWINGPAGAGKTTIAYTVAAACHERGYSRVISKSNDAVLVWDVASGSLLTGGALTETSSNLGENRTYLGNARSAGYFYKGHLDIFCCFKTKAFVASSTMPTCHTLEHLYICLPWD